MAVGGGGGAVCCGSSTGTVAMVVCDVIRESERSVLIPLISSVCHATCGSLLR